MIFGTQTHTLTDKLLVANIPRLAAHPSSEPLLEAGSRTSRRRLKSVNREHAEVLVQEHYKLYATFLEHLQWHCGMSLKSANMFIC